MIPNTEVSLNMEKQLTISRENATKKVIYCVGNYRIKMNIHCLTFCNSLQKNDESLPNWYEKNIPMSKSCLSIILASIQSLFQNDLCAYSL